MVQQQAVSLKFRYLHTRPLSLPFSIILLNAWIVLCLVTSSYNGFDGARLRPHICRRGY